jgi:hypothetical protein
MSEDEAMRILDDVCRSQISGCLAQIAKAEIQQALHIIKQQSKYIELYDDFASDVAAAVHRYESGMNE